MTLLNDHAQPLDPRVQARLRTDRAINEMLGLVKGVLIDGEVSEREALALTDWFAANPDSLKVWPGYVLSRRLKKILADGRVDDEEREHLRALLETTVGEQVKPETNPTTELPLDRPAPPLIFRDQTYVFTGEFAYGTRKDCEAAVCRLGGRCLPRATQKTNVLVIGQIGSRDWAHTSFGRKVESIVRWKRRGLPIAIVEEEHWVDQLGSNDPLMAILNGGVE